MKTTLSFIIGISFAPFLFASDISSFSFDELILRNKAWENRLIEHIKQHNSNESITNASAIWTAGWIHSKEVVPLLLEMVCAQPVEAKIPRNGIPVSAMNFVRGVLPDTSHVHSSPCRFYVVPPTPASAALTQTPVRLETLEFELEKSKTASERMRLLSWIAMAKYGSEFLSKAESRTIAGNDKWQWIFDYANTNLVGAVPFDLTQFGNEVWSDAEWAHRQIVEEMRRRIKEGKEKNDDALVREATEALIEIGELPDLSESKEAGQSVQSAVQGSPNNTQAELENNFISDSEEEESPR